MHQQNKISPSMWALLLAPLPAILLGAFVMKMHALPTQLWVQHLIVGIIFLLIAVLALKMRRSRPSVLNIFLTVAISTALLAGTFFHQGIDGVHRWIKIGPVLLYAAALLLPITLLALGKESNRSSQSTKIIFASALALQLLLFIQPDAAQAAAFAAGMLILLLAGGERSMPKWMLIFLLPAIAAATWFQPDPLHPVAHVEGIFSIAFHLGGAVKFFSMVSMALIPVGIVLAARRGNAVPLISITMYFIVYFAVSLIRPFPIFFLGFGASPIVGYYLFVVFLGISRLEK